MTIGDFDYLVEETLSAYVGRAEASHTLDVVSLEANRQVLNVVALPVADLDYYPMTIVEFGDPRVFRVVKLADLDDDQLGWQDPLIPGYEVPDQVTLRTTPLAGTRFFYGSGPVGSRRIVMQQYGFQEKPTALGGGYGSTSHEMIGTLWVDYDMPEIRLAKDDPNVGATHAQLFRQLVQQVQTAVTQGLITGICRRVFTPEVKFYTVKNEKTTTRRAEIMLSLTAEV